MKRTLKFAAFIAVIIVAASCNPSKKYEEEEKSLIAEYVASHNITVEPDANGLYYIEIIPGTGEPVKSGDSLAVYYVGKFLDGTEFYSNLDEDTPFRFRLGLIGLIEGWNIGLTKMKGGTEANPAVSQLLIPSSLAYGTIGYGVYDSYGRYITLIPGYTPLLYEIRIVEHIKPTK